jgi:hypothetical protein
VIQKKKDVPAAKSSQEGSLPIEANVASAAASSNEISIPMEITTEPINEKIVLIPVNKHLSVQL